MTPTPVSILIITRNHRDLLFRALDSIAKVDYPVEHMQTVILEETDTPLNTLPFSAEYHTIPVRDRGFGFARNTALSYAKNDIIIFVDDDCLVEKNWLQELISPFEHSPDVCAVGGAVLVPPCGPVGECENIIGFPGGGVKYIHKAGNRIVQRPTFSTCNCALRRQTIIEAGGFSEALKYGGEDELLARKMSGKYRILYNPGAMVRHKPRDSLRGVFHWFIRRGRADMVGVDHRRKQSTFALSLITNALAVRAGLVLLVLLLLRLSVVLFFPIAAIYYCALLWRYRWSRTYYPSFQTFFMIPIVRWVMDTGRDAGILREYIESRRKS